MTIQRKIKQNFLNNILTTIKNNPSKIDFAIVLADLLFILFSFYGKAVSVFVEKAPDSV